MSPAADAWDIGGVFLVLGFDVGAWVGLEGELVNDLLFRSEEAHREEAKLSVNDAGGAFFSCGMKRPWSSLPHSISQISRPVSLPASVLDKLLGLHE